MAASPPARGGFAWAAGSAALLALVGAWSIWAQSPPDARPDNTTPPDQFASGRAIRHVEVIARRPHPVGSPEAAEARAYIRAQLEALGLEVEAQDFDRVAGYPSGGQNLVARLRGTGPEGRKALMLAAHSDSVPSGPGAGDDAAGVAAILETLRALRAGPPPSRDVIALITDGEEAGLLGAKLFVDRHPWARRVGLVLNFEARGHRGPVFMFETSEENGWLIRHFAQSAPHPVATSLTYAVYRLMPNNTDLTVFKHAGMTGLNFSFFYGLSHYHTPDDSPANLDERSLQHMGSYALALARHFGALDLDDPHREPDAVYFHVLGHLVVYPDSWAMPLAGIAALAYLVVVALGLWRGRLSVPGLATGTLVSMVAVILAVLASWAAWSLLRLTRPADFRWVAYDIPVLSTLAALAVATTLAIDALAWRVAAADLSVGALAGGVVLAVASTLILPGASYLFTWPVLGASVGWGVAVLAPRADSLLARLGAVAGAIPAMVLLPPTIEALFHALSLMFPAALAAPVAFLAAAPLPTLRYVAAPDVPERWVPDDGSTPD
jgi:hypothetical protein